MIGVDTMTAPECRRQGMLTAIARFAYDTWRKAGIPFVLGLPNEQWGSRTDALGWKALFPLQWLVRPLQPVALLARRLGISALSQLPFLDAVWNRWWDRNIQPDETVHTRQVDRAGAEFDVLWQTCRADRQISAIRDSVWVNWRYVKAPTFAYRVLLAERWGQPVGYCAYRLQETAGRKLGFIAELLGLKVIYRRAVHSLPGHYSNCGQRALRRQLLWPSRTRQFSTPFGVPAFFSVGVPSGCNWLPLIPRWKWILCTIAELAYGWGRF